MPLNRPIRLTKTVSVIHTAKWASNQYDSVIYNTHSEENEQIELFNLKFRNLEMSDTLSEELFDKLVCRFNGLNLFRRSA